MGAGNRLIGILAHVPRSLWMPLAALVIGMLLLPIAAYVAGTHAIASYEGEHGLASYFGAIYAGAARARPMAVAVILGPLLVVAIWKMNAWVWRHTAR